MKNRRTTTNALPFNDRQPSYAPAVPAATARSASAQPAAKPAFIRAPFQPDQQLVSLGITMADQLINTRNWARLRPYFADANAADETTRRNATAVLLGFAMRAAATLCSVREIGAVQFTGNPMMTADDVIYAFKTSGVRFIGALNGIAETLARTLEAVPSLKVERTAARAEDKPMQVQIVGMPSRETATKVRRDPAGDITSSVQIEQDTK